MNIKDHKNAEFYLHEKIHIKLFGGKTKTSLGGLYTLHVGYDKNLIILLGVVCFYFKKLQ